MGHSEVTNLSKDYTLLTNLNDEQFLELSFIAYDMQTDLSHIYKSIDDLQALCRERTDTEIDKHINGYLLADIKDILKRK